MKLILLLIAAVAIAQTPSQPRIYTYYMMPGGTAWIWRSVIIEAPLKLTVDAAGQAHLSATAPACATPAMDYFPTAQASYPLKAPDGAVYLNGVLQDQTNYTLAGNVATFTPPVEAGSVVVVRYSTVCQ